MKIKAWRILILGMLLVSAMLLSGCGDSSSAALGRTVSVTAYGKDGSSFSVYTDLTASLTAYNTASFDYTIKSTAYTGLVGVTASPVSIEYAVISYTPLTATDGTLSPAIPSWTKYVAANLPAGGTVDITMTVVDDLQMTYLDANLPAVVAAPNSVQYRYIVSVVFKGVEINNGKSITCLPVETNFYVTNNADL